jgi:hypothetical protein
MSSKHEIVINNKRIKDFYNNNKHISIEAVNIIVLNLIETINADMTQTMSNTINQEILSFVKEIKGDVSSITNSLIIKFHDINKEFSDNIKLLLNNTSVENIDKITSAITANTDAFVSKIKNQHPKNNDELNNQIKESLNALRTMIIEDFKTNIGSFNKNDDLLREYISGFENKVQLLQNPLYSIINSHQENINNQFSSMKESNVVFQSNQDKVMKDLDEFLNKYRTNSNHKGKYSEHMLEGILNRIYPTAEVVNSSSSIKHSGDFMLKREGKGVVLIENKNYDLAVQKEGVEKFLRDVKTQKCNGLFLSQYSGIQYKPNFFIEIEGSCVLIYLHNVEYSEDKIRTAIDIIDNLSNKLNELNIMNEDEGHVIQNDILDKINIEFQGFISQKESIVFNLKENNKKIIQQIEDLNLNELTIYLNNKFPSLQNSKWTCELCNESFVKKISLNAHKKKCGKPGTILTDIDFKSE